MKIAVNTLAAALYSLKYKLCGAIILLLLAAGATAAKQTSDNEPDLHVIRKQLLSAMKDGKVTDSLYRSLSALKNKAPVITGYLATLEALKAKHAWNPYFKMKYLNDSEKTFESAVIGDPHNMEIRFLRFSVEHNLPDFLGRNKNLDADKDEIMAQLNKKNYTKADNHLVKTIINFLLNSNRCSPAEQENLNQHLAALQ